MTQQWIWMTIQMMEYPETKFCKSLVFLVYIISQNFRCGYCISYYVNYQIIWVICLPLNLLYLRYCQNILYMSNNQTIGFIVVHEISIAGQHFCQHIQVYPEGCKMTQRVNFSNAIDVCYIFCK